MNPETPASQTATSWQAERRPALRPEVMLSGALLSGPSTVHLVKAVPRGHSFIVGEKEYFLMARLDGHRTLEEVGEEYAQHFGRRLGDANWDQLLRLLWTKGLLVGAPIPDPVPEPKRHGLFSGSLQLVPDATALTDRLLRVVGFALRSWILLPALLLVLVMEVSTAAHLGGLFRESRRLVHQPTALLAVGAALWGSSVLHELAHAVAARRFGATVSAIGLRWRLPLLIMYCTVDDLPYLRFRRHQVATTAAGVVMNLLFLLPFWALLAVLPAGHPARSAVAGLLLLGNATALVNLAPLPPLDGYKMLGQALRTHGLAASSRRYLLQRAARTFGRGKHTPKQLAYPRRARITYLAYGLAAALLLGCAAAALAALCHHLLAQRYGIWTAVVPTVLVIASPALGSLSASLARRRGSAQTTPPSRRADER